MAIKIFEGVVGRTSNATASEGVTTYEFIEIGGQRVMKVQASNLLDTFIQVGDNIAISTEKGLGSPHRVCAVREPDGRVTKMEMSVPVITSVIAFGCLVVVSLIPMFFALAIMSPLASLVLGLSLSVGLTYLLTKDLYKARNALDALSIMAPVSRKG
jgi:hypothetical protein